MVKFKYHTDISQSTHSPVLNRWIRPYKHKYQVIDSIFYVEYTIYAAAKQGSRSNYYCRRLNINCSTPSHSTLPRALSYHMMVNSNGRIKLPKSTIQLKTVWTSDWFSRARGIRVASTFFCIEQPGSGFIKVLNITEWRSYEVIIANRRRPDNECVTPKMSQKKAEAMFCHEIVLAVLFNRAVRR